MMKQMLRLLWTENGYEEEYAWEPIDNARGKKCSEYIREWMDDMCLDEQAEKLVMRWRREHKYYDNQVSLLEYILNYYYDRDIRWCIELWNIPEGYDYLPNDLRPKPRKIGGYKLSEKDEVIRYLKDWGDLK